MKKRVLGVLLAAVMMIMAAGCGQKEAASQEGSTEGSTQTENSTGEETPETPEASADNSGVKIGVSMATTQSTFYAKVAQLIEDHCKELGVECMLSDEDYDLNKQISSIENFISAKCTAIILVVFDEEGIKDSVKKGGG